MRLRGVPLALLVVGLAACDCEGGGLSGVGETGPPPRCQSDEDCEPREACFVATGICFARDACGEGRPCPNPEQICVDTNGDTFLECVFERCADHGECSGLECPPDKRPACIAGGCQCGEPCQGGCPSTQGCCVPEDRCYDLPEECMGLSCPPGQFLSVTSSGAWSTGQCRVLGESCECAVLPPLPLGDVGLYSAVAHDGRTAVMSAYNIDYGDLMFGIVGSDGGVEWEFVDGLPATTDAITGDLSGPRGGNSGAGPDVGIHTDIAVDPTGRPHISYQDREKGALRYGIGGSGGWRVHTVEGDGIGDTGLYTSLALDAFGRPRIAYLSAREVAAGTVRRTVLRLAFTSTTTPTAPAHWELRDVDVLNLTAFGCDERCNTGEVCRASDQACVTPDAPPNACGTSCASSERCIRGTCEAIDPLPPFHDLPIARGLWPSLAITPDGGVLIAYYDRLDRNLKLARISGPDLRTGALSVTVIDGTGAVGSTDDTGLFPSLFVTPAGEIHLTYMNATRQSIWYRNLDEQLSTVAAEEIEAGLSVGGGPDGVLIGADSALVVDRLGVARVGYQDATLGDLKYAMRTGPATWSIATLAGNENPYRGSFGFYTDQVLDVNRSGPTVTTYRYYLSAEMGPDNGVSVFRP